MNGLFECRWSIDAFWSGLAHLMWNMNSGVPTHLMSAHFIESLALQFRMLLVPLLLFQKAKGTNW